MKFKNKRTGEVVEWDCVCINSALVSAQQRKRLYWTNIKSNETLDGSVPQPIDQQIYLKDIIENGYVDRLKSYCIDANYYKGTNLKTYLEKGKRQIVYACALRTYPRIPNGEKRIKRLELKEDGKSNCLTGVQTDSLIFSNDTIRKLTPIECERLQTYPDQYSLGISNTQRYKCLGNSFTVKVIEHILKYAIDLNS